VISQSISPSGNPAFDTAAREALARAAPFPATGLTRPAPYLAPSSSDESWLFHQSTQLKHQGYFEMVDSIDPSTAVAAPHGLSPIDLFNKPIPS